METKGFNGFHPVVNFAYFVFVITFSMVFMHPVCLCISLFGGICHLFSLKGKKAFKSLAFSILAVFLMALINPLFSHQGETVLAYFPNGNPFTLESVLYGIGAGFMFADVMIHFLCCNIILTSDKFIYLFGKTFPSVALMISMTLNFVPKFSHRLKSVASSVKCMGKDISNNKMSEKFKHGLNIFSITTTYALENSIDTSLSMKSRGYGLPGKTSYSNFRFTLRDAAVLVFILLSGFFTIYMSVTNRLDFQYYPFVKCGKLTTLSLCAFIIYFILYMTPIIINAKEALTWKYLKSKS